MSSTRAAPVEHATQVAHIWVRDVARVFDTDDQLFAYRALRSWLHCLRDRLTVEAAARFAAQLPDLVRGIWFDGWTPARVPRDYGRDGYVERFAAEASISPHDVPKAAAAVTTAVSGHVTPGQLGKAFDQLPADLRALLVGDA
jgi:uncharacterized protein (DUF2267 family)